MSEAYGKFAGIYDALMYDADYKGLLKYFEKILEKCGKHADGNHTGLRVLDAGCGTGSMAYLMALQGYEVCGIDLSAEMTAFAKKKCADIADKVASEPVFHRCDMAAPEGIEKICGHKFDIAVSFLDCINYITDEDKLAKAFDNIFEALEPGGIFIFDINSPHKLRNILGNNFFYDIGEDECCLWENSYDSEADEVRFDLTFFAKTAPSLYTRTDEVHYEKVYEIHTLKERLEAGGFCEVTVYGNRSFSEPAKDEERCFFVGRKKYADE